MTKALMASAGKKRHQIEGNRIRALYGHSFPGKLSKKVAVPLECPLNFEPLVAL